MSEHDPKSYKAAQGKINTLYAALTLSNEANRQLETKVEELTKVMEAARDDLLIRGDIDSQGCRVVNMSATTWSNFCEAIDSAALKQEEE